MWNESRLQLVKMFAVIIVVLVLITKGPVFLGTSLITLPVNLISSIKLPSFPKTSTSPWPTPIVQTKIEFPTRVPSSVSETPARSTPSPTTKPITLPTSLPRPTTPLSPTPRAQPTDPPTNLSGDFTDDFSGTTIKSNWSVGNGVSQNERLIFSAPARARLQSHSISGDFTATADLVTAQSSSTNWMGIGIAFITYTNGDYGAYQNGSGRRTGDVYLTLSGSSLTVYVNRLRDGNHEDWEKAGEATVSSGSRIQLIISRSSGVYTFSYNGTAIGSVSDGPAGAGFVFLTASERDGNASVRAEFDNFVLQQIIR